jgi:hypothetical protein
MATLEADCDLGPTDQAACVATCESLSVGSCSQEYEAFRDCSVGEDVSCDGTIGIPIVAACASEQAAFIECINAP